MTDMGKVRPSRSGYILVLVRIGMWIYDQFFTFINVGRWTFHTIYCHSPEGDTAAPWRSLRLLHEHILSSRRGLCSTHLLTVSYSDIQLS